MYSHIISVSLALCLIGGSVNAQPLQTFIPFSCGGGGTGWRVYSDANWDGKPDILTIHHCNGRMEERRLDGAGPVLHRLSSSNESALSSASDETDLDPLTSGMTFSKFDCVLGGTGWRLVEDSDGDGKQDKITIRHCNGWLETRLLDGTGPVTWVVTKAQPPTNSTRPAQPSQTSSGPMKPATVQFPDLTDDVGFLVQVHLLDDNGRSVLTGFTSPREIRKGYTLQANMLQTGTYVFNILSEDGSSVLRVGTISLEPEE